MRRGRGGSRGEETESKKSGMMMMMIDPPPTTHPPTPGPYLAVGGQEADELLDERLELGRQQLVGLGWLGVGVWVWVFGGEGVFACG